MLGSFGRVRAHRITLLAILLLAGCTSHDTPTAAQAGQTLKTHILQLLKERNAQNITITDPGGKNVPCVDGKAKQTFAVTATDSSPLSEPQIIKDQLVATLSHIGPYKIVSDKFDYRPVELENVAAATTLFLGSTGTGRIDIEGVTRCLLIS